VLPLYSPHTKPCDHDSVDLRVLANSIAFWRVRVPTQYPVGLSERLPFATPDLCVCA
jgi:hypothetical protein